MRNASNRTSKSSKSSKTSWSVLGVGVIAALAVHSIAHADGSFYCQARIVEVGAARFDVRSYCGTPDDTQQRTEVRTVYRQVSVPCQTGYCTRVVEDSVAVQVEEWTYDFGKQRFVQYLTFEGGKLIRIRSGGYGHKLE